MKSVILKIFKSLERVVRSTSCLIPGAYCQQRANHIVYRPVFLFSG